MKSKTYILILLIATATSVLPGVAYSETSTESVNDGPYFFIENGKLSSLWIKNGVLKQSAVDSGYFSHLAKRFRLKFSLNDLTDSQNSDTSGDYSFTGVEKIAIISDLHGEFQNYKMILRRAGIINKDLDWSFGSGHLVILGDIFDRGAMVTEILWHLYGLTIQATDAGGKVHIVLGNHEYLILTGDGRFVNEKYRYVELITGRPYSTLYGRGSVLGDWLRKMPVAVRINDMLFTHAGISADLVKKKIVQEGMNVMFREFLLGNGKHYNNENLPRIDEETGGNILSYRGYFTDELFCESSLDSILNFYGVRRMIVGHTTQDEVKPMFNNKLLVTDAGLMNYHSGQLLLYSDSTFYRVLLSGRRIRLFGES